MATELRDLQAPEPEAKRLAAVRRYDILDTPPDGSFDRITALAADLFSVPISIISLVDHDRIWFKSRHGLEVEQIERVPGLCASAILQSDPWVLADAKYDARALANPLVAGEFGLRFYVGVPLRTSDGFNLGTLCVIDREPRAVNEQQIARLQHLASVVMDQMELRLSARHALADLSHMVSQKDAALQRSEMMAKEIDHRVMNSLQLVSSLLQLQSRAAPNPGASAQLAVAATRVAAIGRVHQHIYLTDGFTVADAKAYIERLCRDLSGVLRSEKRGEVVVEAIAAEIPTEQLVALGLIVNELVTNAAKHGVGTITVSFARVGSDFSLSVSDEGTGLPAGFDAAAGTGFGMRVASALAHKLEGRVLVGTAEESKGAKLTVLFPDQSQSETN